MLFTTFDFIFIYLPIVFAIYFILNKLRHIRLGIAFLVMASVFFYGYWNYIYVPLIIASFTFNFFVGSKLCAIATKFEGQEKAKKPKGFLTFGILANITLLGYYKYTDFFIENFNGIFGSSVPLMHVILPLGISFFTFTQIAFLVDCYRGFVRERSFINYALFVTYFPHLLAGPIIHHAEMMPQFANLRRKKIHYKNISFGLFLFCVGLFKKVVIADFFARFATYGFDTSTTLSMAEAWVSSLSYTFQLYFDFSGYTDMAIGISYMFNIVLPFNFNSPYKATSIGDFWHRWHMTLSRFLRDYIYIPLGGNRVGETRLYTNLLMVFLIGGIWHGAGWTFVVWGCMHGIGIVISRYYSLHFKKLNKFLAWFLTFNFVNIAWIFFRANDMNSAFKVLGAMFDFTNMKFGVEFVRFINSTFGIVDNIERFKVANASIWGVLLLALIVCVFAKNSQEMMERSRFDWRTALFLCFLLICSFFATRSVVESQFLYFNF